MGKDQHQEITIPPVDFTVHHCDLFCDGRVLLTSARARWHGPGDFDKNTLIFDPNTGETQRLFLGDGIEDLSIDSQDHIWASYFDEDVYGNLGWNHPGPAGPGAGGLVCFAPDGQVLWSFNTPDHDDRIDDCYALNKQRDGVWAYYYSDFNAFHVNASFTPSPRLPIPLSGASAFAVSETAFLFSKQYRDPPNTFYRVPRDGDDLGAPQKLRGLLPDGSSIEACTLWGTGSTLHAVSETAWYATDLTAQDA